MAPNRYPHGTAPPQLGQRSLHRHAPIVDAGEPLADRLDQARIERRSRADGVGARWRVEPLVPVLGDHDDCIGLFGDPRPDGDTARVVINKVIIEMVAFVNTKVLT